VKPGGLSHKEGYDMGTPVPDHLMEEGHPFHEKTPTLSLPGREDEVEAFQRVSHFNEMKSSNSLQFMDEHQIILKNAGDQMFELLAEAGGEDLDYFKRAFGESPIHTNRIIRYPRRKEGEIPPKAKLDDGRGNSTEEMMKKCAQKLL